MTAYVYFVLTTMMALRCLHLGSSNESTPSLEQPDAGDTYFRTNGYQVLLKCDESATLFSNDTDFLEIAMNTKAHGLDDTKSGLGRVTLSLETRGLATILYLKAVRGEFNAANEEERNNLCGKHPNTTTSILCHIDYLAKTPLVPPALEHVDIMKLSFDLPSKSTKTQSSETSSKGDD